MQSNALKKLFLLCQRNGILSIKQASKDINLLYGPLGSLLKRNIFNEWLSSLLISNEFQVFPFEIQNPREKCFLQTNVEQNEMPTAFDSWLNCDKLFRAQPPVCYAFYGPCVRALSGNSPSDCADFGFLRDLHAWTNLTLVFFCPPGHGMQWFYSWSKKRHIWWRKLSNFPEQFGLSGMSSSPDGSSHHLCVQLNSPWGGSLPLEAVSLRGEVMTCELELEAAVVAHLANSHVLKWQEGQEKEVLQLHSRLAPYQVSLWTEERDDELQGAAAHLAEQLKKRGVSVLPSYTLPFSKLDEMGVPYTVVLGKNSLVSGISGLRNRDTTLQEQIHISELTPTLVKYLKMQS